jgi:hypothetical protein
MTLELLPLIASYDDFIKLCGTDVELVDKYQAAFSEERVTNFEPLKSLASNPQFLGKGYDIWAGKKRGYKKLDVHKYCRLFITMKRKFLKDPENNEDVRRDGFDAYPYFVQYEKDIELMYAHKEDLNNLEKATLHFIEIGSPEVELDYLKYVASHDDCISGFLQLNPSCTSESKQDIIDFGKLHYESFGKFEIASGTRQLQLFDALMYVASYPNLQDLFKDDQGEIMTEFTTLNFILVGFKNSLARNGFNASAYLANETELLKGDIYMGKQMIDVHKVAKLWLKNFKDKKIDLTKFDYLTYKQDNNVADDVCVFTDFVGSKIQKIKGTSKGFANSLRSVACVAPVIPKKMIYPTISLPKVPTLPNVSCVHKQKDQNKCICEDGTCGTCAVQN